MLKRIRTSQIVVNKNKQELQPKFIVINLYLHIATCFLKGLSDIISCLSPSEIFNSCQHGLTKIKNESLYLGVWDCCPKTFYSSAQNCSLWCRSMMASTVRKRYPLFKTSWQMTKQDIFEANKKTVRAKKKEVSA